MAGHSELAHDDHVEDGAERSRDRNGHGYAAPRQRQHDGVASGIDPQPVVRCQDGTGVRAIDVRLLAHRSIFAQRGPNRCSLQMSPPSVVIHTARVVRA